MLYLTCTTITSVDLAHYGVYHVKDWVSVDYGTTKNTGKTNLLVIFMVQFSSFHKKLLISQSKFSGTENLF